MVSRPFRILSVDGGGIRGVFPAHILRCISERLGINVHKHFDLIAGTSTGSIIAAGISCNIDPATIVNLYKEHGQIIFTKKKSICPTWPNFVRPAMHSLYESSPLSELLKKILGDVKLGDLKIPLLLPATDIGLGGVHVLKSAFSEGFNRDPNVLVREAVQASCSAPTFFDPIKVGEYLLADGGLWANNPSLAAVTEAQCRLGVERESIRILTIGTGHARTAYGVNQKRLWGLLNGWKGKEFINFIMSLQAQSTHNYLKLSLNEDQVFRINFESDKALPMDDCSAIDDLISRADKEFTYNSKALLSFLQ